MSRLILSRMEYRGKKVLTAALCREKKVCRIHLIPETGQGILGNIYIGKVKNIVPNIQAAFIEIADGIMCYYPMEEKGKNLKIGEELTVQVCREGMKKKLPSVTENLNFTGQYLVLTTERKELGFSRKLPEEEKKRIRGLLEERKPQNAGIIVRTSSRGTADEEILRELEFLENRMETVLLKARTRTCFSLLEQSIPEYLKEVQDACGQYTEEIVTDDPEVYRDICTYLQGFEKKQMEIRLYEDRLLPLYKLYSLESVLEEALKEKVWMKSGGFLVIQQTEAFVSIDVNTGKFTVKKDQEETYRRINLEAAREIARQLRLRNLSGIILIDFINMKSKEDGKRLMEALQDYLDEDSVKASVVDMTALNIVEVTRKKVRKPLSEEVKEIFSSGEECV